MHDALVEDLSARWGFTSESVVESGHCSKVYLSKDRALKIPFLGEEMTSGFQSALQLSNAGIGPTVYESDAASGALLMERMIPGITLDESGLDDPLAMNVFTGLAKRIARLDGSELPSLTGWFSRPGKLLDYLLASSPKAVYLHGDLHHGNILRNGSQWMAIDPKGLVGDQAFECAAYLRNPVSQIASIPDFVDFSRKRIRALAIALELDPRRVWAWSMVDMLEGEETRAADSPWWIVQKTMARLEAQFTPKF